MPPKLSSNEVEMAEREFITDIAKVKDAAHNTF